MTSGIVVLVVSVVLPVLGMRTARRWEREGREWGPFLLRRAGWLVITTLAIFTISFLLMRAVPGGPFDEGKRLEPAVLANLEARFGLDRPLTEQWLVALGGLPLLDFGPTLTLQDFSVRDVIGHGLPSTVLLGVAALFWTLALGVPVGVLAALARGRRWDGVLSAAVSLGVAVPNFVLAGVLMVPLVFWTGWLPAAGLDSMEALVLPSFCLGLPFAAQVARLARTGMLEVLGQDWIRTARAKGLSESRVILRHALTGAMTPVVTFLGPALAGILTGSLVIEQVFAIPGIGTHFVQSALNRDYTLALGMIVLYTILVFILNALADVLIAALDPRVRLS